MPPWSPRNKQKFSRKDSSVLCSQNAKEGNNKVLGIARALYQMPSGWRNGGVGERERFSARSKEKSRIDFKEIPSNYKINKAGLEGIFSGLCELLASGFRN